MTVHNLQGCVWFLDCESKSRLDFTSEEMFS
jgi:hypothetical protein